MLLLFAIIINVSQADLIKNNLNNLDSDMVVREIDLKYNIKDRNTTVEEAVQAVKIVSDIENVTVISLQASEELLMKVIVNDYKKVTDVIDQLAIKEGYEVIVEESKLVNIEIIRVVEVMSYLSLGIIMLLTYFTFLINLQHFIEDRKYEIALYKAFGYQDNQLLILLLFESIFMVFISFIFACLIGCFIINLFIIPAINEKNITDIIGNKLTVDYLPVMVTLFLSCLLTSLSSLTALNRIKKISSFVLIKQKGS